MFPIKCLSSRLNNSLRSCSSISMASRSDDEMTETSAKRLRLDSFLRPASRPGRPALLTWTSPHSPSENGFNRADAECSATPEDGPYPLLHCLGAMAGPHLSTDTHHLQELRGAGVAVRCSIHRHHHQRSTKLSLIWWALRAQKIKQYPQHRRDSKGIHWRGPGLNKQIFSAMKQNCRRWRWRNSTSLDSTSMIRSRWKINTSRNWGGIWLRRQQVKQRKLIKNAKLLIFLLNLFLCLHFHYIKILLFILLLWEQ